MRVASAAILAVTLVVGVPATETYAQSDSKGVRAHAALRDAAGKPVGTVKFQQMAEGVLIRIELEGLPPGWHAIHIHENAACEPPFASAGEHLNPSRSRHGYDEGGPHAGDLPNIFVHSDGKSQAEMFNDRIALAPDRPTEVQILNRAVGALRSATGTRAANLLSGNGSSVIVHAGPDDHSSEPAGNAGDGIACGVVQRS